MMLPRCLVLLVILTAYEGAYASDDRVAGTVRSELSPEVVAYKTVHTEKGDFALKLHIFEPENSTTGTRPCIVMFHSGGWNNGEPTRCYSAAKRWASRGMVAVAVEYRVRDIHGGTALDSVRDAKSAIRWIRSQASRLRIDSDRIAAQGSSAGGHLAAACAVLTSFDEEGEDTTISCVPNALLLKSPVLDNGPDGYGQYKKEVHNNWQDFSPFHNIRKGAPPTLVSVGTNEEKYLRLDIAKSLKQKMEKLGSRCELIILKGATHRKRTSKQNDLVDREQVKFLSSLGYIKDSQ